MKFIKNNTLIFIGILIFFAVSCKKSKNNSVVIDAVVDIQFVNEQNENLIGQVETVDFNNLKIYYLINGKSELFSKGNLEHPKGYMIFKDKNGKKIVRLFLNTQGRAPITLIQFNKADTDTVKCEFYKKDGSIICKKVWYNNALKWEVNGNSSKNREILIVKKF